MEIRRLLSGILARPWATTGQKVLPVPKIEALARDSRNPDPKDDQRKGGNPDDRKGENFDLIA